MPPMEDRISLLPDPVLCHILSFLPTQEAVATSLLSKRWRPLWLSAPSLHLHDESFLENGTKTYSSFFKFVYAAILARSLHYQPLKTFTLLSLGSCRQHEQEISYSHLMIWVNAVIQRGIEHLNIGLGSRLELPRNILSCRTLVVLKLTCLLLSTCSPVDLPALKTLSLNRLRMLHARYLAELLDGCPILENFEAKELIVRNESTAVEFKSLPKLKSVEISDFSGVDIPWKAICNVEFLCFSPEIDSQIDEDYIPVFHNLIHLDLKFGKWPLVFDMIEHCPKLRSLVLYNLVPSKWAPEIWHSPKLVPECISSQLRKFTFSNYGGKEYELQFAKYIMQNSRALLTITIHNFYLREYKLEMLQELAFCPRSSAACQLSFT